MIDLAIAILTFLAGIYFGLKIAFNGEEKKIDELADTDKTRGAERLSRIVGVDIPRPLTELERLTAELVEDLHDRGMTDEEIKKEYFADGCGGAVSLFQGVEEAKKSDSPYKQTLLHFDEALDGMMVKHLKKHPLEGDK